jgi:hypothetical protein
LAKVDVGRFGKFRLAAPEEVPTTGADDGDACGCHDLVGDIIEEYVCPSFTVSTLEGNLRSLGSGDEGVVLRISPP